MKRNLRTKIFILLCAFLSLAGIALRIKFSFDVLSSDPFSFAPPVVTDMATYLRLSNEIVSGTFNGVFYYQPFYYAVFLPLLSFFGDAMTTTSMAQSVLAGLTAYLAGLSSAMIFGRKSGVIACVLAAFSAMLFLYVPYAMLEIMECFFFTLLFFLTLKSMKKKSLLLWVMTGLVFSFAILSRGNAWCFLPAILFAIFSSCRNELKKAFTVSAVFLIAAVLPQVPFAMHNTLETGKLCGPSTEENAVLAIGNNPESAPGGLEVPPPRTYQLWLKDGGKDVKKHVLAFALDKPLAFSELQLRKLLLFLDFREMPNNIVPGLNGEESCVYKKFGVIPSWLMIFLALSTFFAFASGRLMHVRLRGKKKPVRLLFSFIILYVVTASAFYVLTRFRVPVLGLFCIAGSAFPVIVYDVFRGRSFKKVFYLVIGPSAAAFFFVFGAFDLVNLKYAPAIHRYLDPDGIKVNVSDDEKEYVDNAPFVPYSGARMPIEIAGGRVIEKRFAADAEGKTAVLSLRIYAPAGAMLDVNGENYAVPPSRGKIKDFVTRPFMAPDDGIFRIKAGDDRSFFVLLDVSRDFSRTKIPGVTDALKGELVSRLTLTAAVPAK